MTTKCHVALFDYGAGNLHSLAKGLEAGGARVTITTDWGEALGLDALVLPGVGSFGAATRSLAGHEKRVREALAGGYPSLGICLGMQLLLSESEEGDGGGIGLVPGNVRRLRAGTVPQMGWNDVDAVGDPDPLVGALDSRSVYFANSYVCDPDDESVVVARSQVEEDSFPVVVRVARSWGVQFHPEKSSTPGLALLRAFLQEVAR